MDSTTILKHVNNCKSQILHKTLVNYSPRTMHTIFSENSPGFAAGITEN